jgi:hypothetical protein
MNKAQPATREKWRRIIESQRVSGQTAAAWCREHDIAYASFFAWKRRLASVLPAVDFVEILAAAESRPADTDPALGTTGAIQVCCRGGRTLVLRRGFDRRLLVEVIDVLEGSA